MFFICYRGKRILGPMTEAEAMREWFTLSGTVKEIYIIEVDENDKVRRQIGPTKKKRNKYKGKKRKNTPPTH